MPKTGLGASDSDISALDFRRRYLELVSETFDELEVFGIDTRQYCPKSFVTTAYVTLSVRPGDNGSEVVALIASGP
jgi:hypothetical protein